MESQGKDPEVMGAKKDNAPKLSTARGVYVKLAQESKAALGATDDTKDKIPEKKKVGLNWILAGASAIVALIVILICYYIFTSPPSPPSTPDFVRKGRLRVYPNVYEPSFYGEGYILRVSPLLPKATFLFENFFRKYNSSQEGLNRYTDCWRENPTRDRPCAFSTKWLEGDNMSCSWYDKYGYQAPNPSPCFLIYIDGAGEWIPAASPKMIKSTTNPLGADPSFVNINCEIDPIPIHPGIAKVSIFPKKGFPIVFFPISAYEPSRYLAPLIMVKVINVTAETRLRCHLQAINAHYLEDRGKVKIVVAP